MQPLSPGSLRFPPHRILDFANKAEQNSAVQQSEPLCYPPGIEKVPHECGVAGAVFHGCLAPVGGSKVSILGPPAAHIFAPLTLTRSSPGTGGMWSKTCDGVLRQCAR